MGKLFLKKKILESAKCKCQKPRLELESSRKIKKNRIKNKNPNLWNVGVRGKKKGTKDTSGCRSTEVRAELVGLCRESVFIFPGVFVLTTRGSFKVDRVSFLLLQIYPLGFRRRMRIGKDG